MFFIILLFQAQQMQTLFDFLRRYRREDGSELCETFIRAPKRRTEPGYYEVVTDPIDMLRIQQKLKMDEYGNMEELKEDFGKLLKNALSYYKKGSQEFKDAVELQDLFVKAAGNFATKFSTFFFIIFIPHVRKSQFCPKIQFTEKFSILFIFLKIEFWGQILYFVTVCTLKIRFF